MSRLRLCVGGFCQVLADFALHLRKGYKKHGSGWRDLLCFGGGDYIDDRNHGYTGGLSQALFKSCWLERAAQLVDRV